MRRRLDEILAKHTGQDLEKVAQRHRARLLHERGRGQAVQPHRPRDFEALRAGRSSRRGFGRLLEGTSTLAAYLCATLAPRRRERVARPTDSNEQLLCSFCGKSQRQVKKLIAGPGVYICDECIDLCNEIIDEELTGPADVRPREPPEAEGDLLRPPGVRGGPGAGQAHALGRRLQPLQARADDAVGRASRTSSCRSPTSCCSARPAAARRCSPRRSRRS